jgi:hypothetical protein
MLDRIRIEVMEANEVDAMARLDDIQSVIAREVKKESPDAVIEITDQRMPIGKRDGVAFVNGRRVVRFYPDITAFHDAHDNSEAT